MSRPLPAPPKPRALASKCAPPWIARPGGMALRHPCRPGSAEARWHGGGWHGHGGWGGGGFGWGFAPGFAIGFGAPYYGGYYGGPYYAYGGDCVMRRRWVINRWGHRVLRWTRVCY